MQLEIWFCPDWHATVLEHQREHSKTDQTLRKLASNFSRVKPQMKGHENKA